MLRSPLLSLPRAARLPAAALILTGIAAACAPVLADETGRPAADPVRCEVLLDAQGSGTRLRGRVHADQPVRGSYVLRLTSRSAGGQVSLSQSGDFDAAPGRPADLGETRLPGSPAQQQVDLTLRLGDRQVACSSR